MFESPSFSVTCCSFQLFKSEVDPKHSDIEALNQKADELVKDTSPDQAVVVTEPMSAVNLRWDGLLDGIGDRQRLLQLAMLDVGQFEHAMNELLAWLDKTEQTLDECKPVYGDRKLVEIELAKHKVKTIVSFYQICHRFWLAKLFHDVAE